MMMIKKKRWMLLSFPPPPNTSYIFSILCFYLTQKLASPSRCFSPREGWKWKENPICWEITDWLNIYKIDYSWVFTSHGTGGFKEQEEKKNVNFMFPRSIYLFGTFWAEQMVNGQMQGDWVKNKGLCLFVLNYFPLRSETDKSQTDGWV